MKKWARRLPVTWAVGGGNTRLVSLREKKVGVKKEKPLFVERKLYRSSSPKEHEREFWCEWMFEGNTKRCLKECQRLVTRRKLLVRTST